MSADAIEFFHNRHIGHVEGSKDKVIIDRVFFQALLNLRDRTGNAGVSTIVDNPVPTSQIAAGAVSQIAAATTLAAAGSFTRAWTTIQTVTLTTTGGPCIVEACAQVLHAYVYQATNNGGGLVWAKGLGIRVQRDGSTILDTQCAHVTPGWRDTSIVYAAGAQQLVAFSFVDSAPSAASHTYTLQIQPLEQWNGVTQSDDAYFEASVRTLAVTELKR
jgi:hypothetical protein